MREIQVTHGYVALVDDDDYAMVTAYDWYPRHNEKRVYATTTIKGRSVEMHRLIMGEPEALQVDHINGNGLDNRRSVNLRVVTQSQNQRNQRNRTWKHGLPGITPYDKDRWIAQGSAHGKAFYLGVHDTKEEASQAYLDHLALTNDPRHGLTLPSRETLPTAFKPRYQRIRRDTVRGIEAAT